MREEKTKLKESVVLSIETPFVPETIPKAQVPSDFQIKYYRPNNLVLVVIPASLFEELRTLCEKRGYRVEEVIYGSLLKVKSSLERLGKDNQ